MRDNLDSSFGRSWADGAATVLALLGGGLVMALLALRGYTGPRRGVGLLGLTALVVGALVVEAELLTRVRLLVQP